jgi:signal transduction histidine kinase
VRRLGSLSIRWRLALTSAGLTFAILLLFALVVAAFTGRRLASDFDNDLRATTADLQQKIPVRSNVFGPVLTESDVAKAVVDVVNRQDAAVRLINAEGRVLTPVGGPDLGAPTEAPTDIGEYRVVSRPLFGRESLRPVAYVQYGKRQDSLRATTARLKLFLVLGVIGGTGLALLAGLAVARRAMKPIADLTGAARQIARTRNPAERLPHPAVEDEVAALAQTLDEMLEGLDMARRNTEATLEREREFVADASHELRTPLTSIFANLELLEASLDGEDRETAASALRSSRRMRRLVADLLLLARADAGRPAAHGPVDLGPILRAAAAEAGAAAEGHDLSVEAPAGLYVEGWEDDLHRVALNLIENALQHTPDDTAVRASVRRSASDIVLDVSDDGPGLAPELRARAFERFVRGEAAGAGRGPAGTGLGLSIVRAVAERHGGRVEVGDAQPGARFTVRLPAAAPPASQAADQARQTPAAATSN